jgi:urease accessory protein
MMHAPPLAQVVAGPARRHWPAHLRIGATAEAGGTVLRSRHSGPLRMQKTLYPEGNAVAHALVVHPPGGIASGDELDLDVHCHAGSHVLVTTPGATKWYRGLPGAGSRQTCRLQVDAGASLEWLPQEAIVFDDCDGHAAVHLDLASDARCIGWDIWVFGRHAQGERFASGQLRLRTRLLRDGHLQWCEQSRIDATALRRTTALNGAHVCGVLWAAGNLGAVPALDDLRDAHPDLALTAPVPDLLLARMIGRDPETLVRKFRALWCTLRPGLLQRAAQLPRIWST